MAARTKSQGTKGTTTTTGRAAPKKAAAKKAAPKKAAKTTAPPATATRAGRRKAASAASTAAADQAQAQAVSSAADAKAQLSQLSQQARTKGHTAAMVRKAQNLALVAKVDVPVWARPADQSPSRRAAAGKSAAKARPAVDPSFTRAARYANGGQGQMKGDGPAAPITGPNLAALAAALDAAKVDPSFGHDRQLRTFAHGGKVPSDDVTAALRAFVKDAAAPIDARTFYGRKFARMLVAIADLRAGRIKD